MARSGETTQTGRELGKRKGQRTASLSHQRSHRAPVSLKERAKRPNRKTPAPRCHSETELETWVLKPKIQSWKILETILEVVVYVKIIRDPGALTKDYGPQTLWDLTSKILNRLQTHILGLSDLRFEDSELLRSSDQGPGWSRGFWLARQLNEV